MLRTGVSAWKVPSTTQTSWQYEQNDYSKIGLKIRESIKNYSINTVGRLVDRQLGNPVNIRKNNTASTMPERSECME
jgi:hypothetical protein